MKRYTDLEEQFAILKEWKMDRRTQKQAHTYMLEQKKIETSTIKTHTHIYNAHTHTRTSAHTHAHKHVQTHTHTHTHTHTRIHPHTPTHTNKLTNLYTHTHWHTCNITVALNLFYKQGNFKVPPHITDWQGWISCPVFTHTFCNTTTNCTIINLHLAAKYCSLLYRACSLLHLLPLKLRRSHYCLLLQQYVVESANSGQEKVEK